MLFGAGVVLLVAAGICYQTTGGDLGCHLMLGVGAACCIAAFALVWTRREPG